MANEQFYQALKYVHSLLKSVGIPVETKSKSVKQILKNAKLFWFNMICLNFLNILFLDLAFDLLKEADLRSLLFLWPCISYDFLAMSKMCAVILNVKTVEALVKRFEDFRNEKKDLKLKVAYESFQKKEFKTLKIILLLTFVFNISLTCNFCGVPLIIMADIYFKTGELQFMLPVPTKKYPFLDQFNNARDFIIVYIHQTYTSIFSALASLAPDFLLYLLCSCIYIQFQELEYKAKRVVENSCKNVNQELRNEDNDIDNELLHQKMLDIIMRHQELLRMVDEVNEIFTKSILFNFVTSSSFICVSGFNAFVVMEGLYKLPFFLLSGTILWQMFIMCYYGDLIMRSNSTIADAIVKCNWYNTDKNFKQLLQIIVVRSQKPCQIKAYLFLSVDLQSFRKFLTTTWSYFTLLNTVYSEE